MFSLSYLNMKPGVGKTTSAVWTCYALHQQDIPVALYDVDKAASASAWNDALFGATGAGFPFKLIPLPLADVHQRADEHAGPEVVKIFDVPQAEDHMSIARSVMRYVDEIVIPVAPSPIEIERMSPTLRMINEVQEIRNKPARVSVLLNRVVSAAASGQVAADQLAEEGYEVLKTRIPRLELYQQSFGRSCSASGTAYWVLAEELIDRQLAVTP